MFLKYDEFSEAPITAIDSGWNNGCKSSVLLMRVPQNQESYNYPSFRRYLAHST